MSEPTRPALRYFGGKWLLAPWIIAHLPRHHVYVEPFGGAASVLMRKPRSYAEVYNELDAEVSGLFALLRDPASSARLIELLELTAFSREDYDLAWTVADDPLERARRLVVRSFMGHGANSATARAKSGFRADANNAGTSPARDWVNFPEALALVAARLRGVVIESRPAQEIIARFDKPKTLFYVDPPYVWETRTKPNSVTGEPWHGYRHEMDNAAHEELLRQLLALEGMVVLSGYRCELYDDLLGGWERIDREARADAQGLRMERLWLNPAASAAAPMRSGPGLFGDGE